MTLAAGVRLGPYEVLASLGAGGMGEVYRARDTKLGRDVALKVLPELFAADPERLARLHREAQVLASLNHPHIAAIYGFEESPNVGAGFSRPIHALVLELIEGETLADRIARGPLPLDEALPIAKQIAEALEAAHEQGITHRDLKPSNIKITPNGDVKVLDFGLAKLAESAGSGQQAAGSAPLSMSPTITSPAMMTGIGVLLGTAAYMSPEQAKGRAADKRSDIWAFGCVLYEMITSKRPFGGEDVTETLAAILMRDADWSALPAGTPPAIRTLLKGCLEKDRRQRFADISTPRFLMSDRAAGASSATPVQTSPVVPQQTVRRMVAIGVGSLVVGAAVAASAVWFDTRPAPPRVARFTIITTGPAALTINGVDRDLAVTPDGTRIVYAGDNGRQLFVRALDQLDPTAIVAGAVRNVFVAPDGQWVGFATNLTLRKVAVTGGPSVLIFGRLDGTPRGATWLSDGTIVFATINAATGLLRVSDAGGEAAVLTRPDRMRGEADHLWPEVIPGRRAVLFTIASVAGGIDAAQVAVLDLDTGTYKVLVRGGSHAHYFPSGHLVYTAGGTLRAVAFDVKRLETHGSPVPVLPRLVTTPQGGGEFSIAADGTLVYADVAGANASLVSRTLVWVDRRGREEALMTPPRAYVYPRLSPDGTQIAVSAADQEQDVWTWNLARQTLTRLTFDPGNDNYPVWTPDGRRVVLNSQPGGAQSNVFWTAADGTGRPRRLTQSNNQQQPTAVSPDGTRIVFNELGTMQRDLVTLSIAGNQGQPASSPSTDQTRGNLASAQTLLQTPFEERNGIVSPDGRWVAYESDSSGRFELYVRPFPDVSGGQWQVSTSGGIQPLWARSGRELFYLALDGALMTVPLDTRAGTWTAGSPAKIFDGRYFTGAGANLGRTYDVSSDGQKFLMIKQGGSDQSGPAPTIIVVQNWGEELKRLVPVK